MNVGNSGCRDECCEVLLRACERYDLGVLHKQVEEIRVARLAGAVADRISHDHRHEAVLTTIECGRPDTATRRDAPDEQGVDAVRRERRGEREPVNTLFGVPGD